MLYIVATPIGNLKDITLRALEVLKEVDGIICEDSRRTSLLLNHYQIKKPLLVLNDYNEARVFPSIVEKLKIGENLVLVSDAGTPLISDPGYKLVRTCLEENIPVDSLPGPASPVVALTLSGLPPDKFLFLGYLPEKPGKRTALLNQLPAISHTLPTTFIAFISPHKLIKTLEDMLQVYGNLEVVLAHELTKVHQSVKKDSLKNWLSKFKTQKPKGEYVLLFNLS
ncbi:MAG: Ribosomal RNA small subunit methyltransferase I [Candidatus Daviesbacteria bacterium GW2011_GWA1_41_61]|uniref:Ribosomal RNA small subunit methyltransferase I n=1 Tax=Candidatus Daviesbacteria bacterium GW2011_GWA2_40_9 TaxID=1618424 RepID=A0A0G0X5K0_9BACT|nr:MAG: Ribosomal RNA small subunit methyltransferase I [Candidatus Daviesbacteria bacterium GW2011_GWC1_40_9]KKR82922.1 MAG: Ribosomal RNA small subunit methyltransferase I [Candidatus Daviesbacteria bacterium GW2011_GWA2_40_9]KKR92850.1 MAG: Ribosomal RNA small subunit methyltransferase I [Candidatus Daviesbacteria bacterium GW2011_GWB1_41_15]KKS15394.1 MAG: Ribosomal RNA small subunit methyltransferase I [Candidatus Daviesbacteria bacterium GW2011_GWA1_41_61]